jgi:hypothetical protein
MIRMLRRWDLPNPLTATPNPQPPFSDRQVPFLGARLLRLAFLSSSLRRALEDRVLGTTTSTLFARSPPSAGSGRFVEDSDSKVWPTYKWIVV